MRADSGCEPLHVADDTSRGARGARAARFSAGCQEFVDEKGSLPKLVCHVANLHANSSHSCQTHVKLMSHSTQTHLKLISNSHVKWLMVSGKMS